MSVYKGKWIEITSVKEVETLPKIPKKLKMIPGNEGWNPHCVAEPITLVEFKIATEDSQIPGPKMGEAVWEFEKWVLDSIKEGTLDTTRGIAFSGRMIAHFSFMLGHVSHIFSYGGVFEPRIGGGWWGQSHGSIHPGEGSKDPFFLDL